MTVKGKNLLGFKTLCLLKAPNELVFQNLHEENEIAVQKVLFNSFSSDWSDPCQDLHNWQNNEMFIA